nr:MAG TPA: hypothetical protein [Caudoviricetes sp.]
MVYGLFILYIFYAVRFRHQLFLIYTSLYLCLQSIAFILLYI